MKTSRKREYAFNILRLSNPVYANLEITYACPGRCHGCPSVSAPDRSLALSGPKWSAIICDLAKFVEEVRLTGGEPTHHPDFYEILESLRKMKIPFKIYTNGLWPDPHRIVRELKKYQYFRGFLFSLHGSIPSIHEAFSGLEDFNEILSNMEIAVKNAFPVYTSSVLGEFNRKNVAGILKLVTHLGSRRHNFVRYIGPNSHGITIFREDLANLLDDIRGIPVGIFSYRVWECFPKCFYPGSSPCLAGITHITINPLGFVKACPFSSEILGKWKGGERTPITGKRRILEWASDFPKSCLRCEEIEACMGGCRAIRRNLSIKRDPLMEEPIIRVISLERQVGEKPLILHGYPKLRCRVRREEFGYVLMQEGEVIPITAKGFELLRLCDGKRGIGEIEEIAGPKAMEFLLSLYVRGFLEIVEETK